MLGFLLQVVSSLSSLDQFVNYMWYSQLLEPFGLTEHSLEVQRGYSAVGSLPLLRVGEYWAFENFGVGVLLLGRGWEHCGAHRGV